MARKINFNKRRGAYSRKYGEYVIHLKEFTKVEGNAIVVDIEDCIQKWWFYAAAFLLIILRVKLNYQNVPFC